MASMSSPLFHHHVNCGDFPDEDEMYSTLGGVDDLFTDYMISEDDLPSLLALPTETWKDLDNESNAVTITMDSAKDYQWELTKKEIKHI